MTLWYGTPPSRKASLRDKLTDRGWVECPKTHCNGPRDCVGTERGCHVCAPGLGCNCCEGLVPPDDQVEAATHTFYKGIFGGFWWDLGEDDRETFRKHGRVALVAAARKEKG